jgi:hypothetical protein
MSDSRAFADDKDWTWVLEEVCGECRFDVREFEREKVGSLIRDNAASWQEVLALPDTGLRQRPTPDKWSPLEYACHVRDVFELYFQRLQLMLNEDGPRYPNWDQDATAIEKSYGLVDPAVVAVELSQEANLLADLFDSVEGAQWDRTGYRSDGAEFTVHSFARYLIHDPIHHLWDVTGPRPEK